MKKIITIEYELDEIDSLILDVLGDYSLSVSQIRSLLRYKTKHDFSPHILSLKLNSLSILGLVEKEKKNSRIF